MILPAGELWGIKIALSHACGSTFCCFSSPFWNALSFPPPDSWDRPGRRAVSRFFSSFTPPSRSGVFVPPPFLNCVDSLIEFNSPHLGLPFFPSEMPPYIGVESPVNPRRDRQFPVVPFRSFPGKYLSPSHNCPDRLFLPQAQDRASPNGHWC